MLDKNPSLTRECRSANPKLDEEKLYASTNIQKRLRLLLNVVAEEIMSKITRQHIHVQIWLFNKQKTCIYH